MEVGNSLTRLHEFDVEILGEIVREGESRVQAQLDSANSSDQRAMAWAGFLITITLASVGAAASLAIAREHLWIAGIAACFSLTTGFASSYAIDAARPTGFCFPGNQPTNWLPENWTSQEDAVFDMKHARVEQAMALESMIRKNSDWANTAGRKLNLSMDFLMWGAGFWGLFLAIAVLFNL